MSNRKDKDATEEEVVVEAVKGEETKGKRKANRAKTREDEVEAEVVKETNPM